MQYPSIVQHPRVFTSSVVSNNLRRWTEQQGLSFSFVHLDAESESFMRFCYGRRVDAKNVDEH